MTKRFKTNNVVVRKFQLKDAEQTYLDFVYDSDNSKFNSRTIGNEKINCENIEETKLIIKSAINEFHTDESIWAVEDTHGKKLVGFIRVTNYSKKNKMCNITWAMLHRYLESGFMSDALIQVFNFLFFKKGIELIECSYYGYNKDTSNLLEEVGMTKEAVLRNRRINGQTHEREDFTIYSICRGEFDKYICSNSVYAKKKHGRFFKKFREKNMNLIHKKISYVNNI